MKTRTTVLASAWLAIVVAGCDTGQLTGGNDNENPAGENVCRNIDCDDGDPCTTDTCVQGQCRNTFGRCPPSGSAAVVDHAVLSPESEILSGGTV